MTKTNHKRRIISEKIMVSLLALFLVFNTDNINANALCYKTYYITDTGCASCNDTINYDNSQKDNCLFQHSREYGIKLCYADLHVLSDYATFYKRGYVDYNCLAYALKKNSPNSWTWPSEWGQRPSVDVVKKYFKDKGYYINTNYNLNIGNDVIYVYANNGAVTHFARKYTLDGNSINGVKTISKCGAAALYTTSTIDAFSDEVYGKPVFMAYRNTSYK